MGRFLVLTVVVALSLPCVVRAEDAKLPVPDDAAQKEVLALIKEIYGEKWADAKTDQQKQALAKELLAKAAESPNTTNKYVLLRVARDTAKQDLHRGSIANVCMVQWRVKEQLLAVHEKPQGLRWISIHGHQHTLELLDGVGRLHMHLPGIETIVDKEHHGCQQQYAGRRRLR